MRKLSRTRPAVQLPARVARTRRPAPRTEVFNLDEWTGGRLIHMYLMASYLYYQADLSIITDSEYDALCKKLLKELPNLGKHQHRKFVSREALKAGTAYHLTYNDYPLMVKSAAEYWYKKLKGNS